MYHLALQRLSCKVPYEGGDEEVDRRRGGKTTSKSGQEWSLLTPRGLSRRGKRGESWLESHQWCPNDPYGLWESEEDIDIYIDVYIYKLFQTCSIQIDLGTCLNRGYSL